MQMVSSLRTVIHENKQFRSTNGYLIVFITSSCQTEMIKLDIFFLVIFVCPVNASVIIENLAWNVQLYISAPIVIVCILKNYGRNFGSDIIASSLTCTCTYPITSGGHR